MSQRGRAMLWACVAWPAYARAQPAPRSPRAVTLTLDAGCPRPVARALREDLSRPERTRVALTPLDRDDVYRATVRCDDGAVTLQVRAQHGTTAVETLRGVAPHDLREPLLGLLDRVEALDAVPPRPPIVRIAPSPPPRASPERDTPMPPRWTLHLGPSMRVATVSSTVFWGVSGGATVDLTPRLGLSIAGSVERGAQTAPQIEGLTMTLFGVALGAYVTAFASTHLRWTAGLDARLGAAAQQEMGPRAREHLAAWAGSAITTAVTLVVAPRLSVRAGAEAGVAAAAAFATVGDERVIGAGPFWFGASLALGWSP